MCESRGKMYHTSSMVGWDDAFVKFILYQERTTFYHISFRLHIVFVSRSNPPQTLVGTYLYRRQLISHDWFKKWTTYCTRGTSDYQDFRDLQYSTTIFSRFLHDLWHWLDTTAAKTSSKIFLLGVVVSTTNFYHFLINLFQSYSSIKQISSCFWIHEVPTKTLSS